MTVSAPHIEKGLRLFFVKFWRPTYFNVYHHEAKWITAKVMATTSQGALRVAKYHWFKGEQFQVVEEPTHA
jgi:hypothetical protein